MIGEGEKGIRLGGKEKRKIKDERKSKETATGQKGKRIPRKGRGKKRRTNRVREMAGAGENGMRLDD